MWQSVVMWVSMVVAAWWGGDVSGDEGFEGVFDEDVGGAVQAGDVEFEGEGMGRGCGGVVGVLD